jgi:hypothetical protein
LRNFTLLGIARHPFKVSGGFEHLIARNRKTKSFSYRAALQGPASAPLALRDNNGWRHKTFWP